MRSSAEPLPVVVIGGYLGAGKTTLVNHLLRQASGRRIAVLVNDFGSVDIDADLIAQAAPGTQADVLSLAGGCLCCSFGNDLVGTLRAVRQREPAVDVVIIELSGVALPAPVRGTLTLVEGLVCAGTLVLADAAEVQRQAADRYVGDTVRQQLAQADWVLLNKPDLCSAEALASAQAWVARAASAARVVACAADQLPAELVLDWPPAAVEVAHRASAFAGRPIGHAARDVFESRVFDLPAGTDLHVLGRALAAPGSGVLRAKGLAVDASGSGALLQVAGARHAVTPAAVQGAGRLVVIGLRGHLDGLPPMNG